MAWLCLKWLLLRFIVARSARRSQRRAHPFGRWTRPLSRMRWTIDTHLERARASYSCVMAARYAILLMQKGARARDEQRGYLCCSFLLAHGRKRAGIFRGVAQLASAQRSGR